MYKTSKDYERLYEMLLLGHKAVGFVDFKFRNDGPTSRDVCAINRDREYSIHFGVRGNGYADVYPFMREDGSEKELFLGACKAINLEWIEPTANQS